RDFSPVAKVVESPLFIVTNAQTPIKSLSELLGYAKANPGKLNLGTTSPQSDLEMGLIKARGGLDVTIVPYKGSAATTAALLANEIQLHFDSYRGAKPLAESGKVRLLAASGLERSALAPSIPTLTESGLPEFTGFWYGIVGPPALPAAAVARLNRDTND